MHIQRQAVTELKDLSTKDFFWKNLGIKEIYELLRDLITRTDYTFEEPLKQDFTTLSRVIDQRLQELNTSAMQRECVMFAKDADNAHRTTGAGQDGEKWMKLKCTTAMHLGNYQDAAKYAAILADVYYFNHHAETDGLAARYNFVAGKLYEYLGNVHEACHHYNQFLDVNFGGPTPEYAAKAKQAAEYLLNHDGVILGTYGKEKVRWFSELQPAVDLRSAHTKTKAMPVIAFPEGYTENHLADAVANVFQEYFDQQSYTDKIEKLTTQQSYLKNNHGPSAFFGPGIFAYAEPPSYLPAIIEMRTINETMDRSLTSTDLKMLTALDSYLPERMKQIAKMQNTLGLLLPKVDMPAPSFK